MRAILVGATGAVGGALLAELRATPEWTQVVALVRRPTDLGSDPKLVVEQVDFDDLEAATAHFGRGVSHAFCAVGIGQPRKVAFDEFWRVDVDYAGAFARGAKAAGAERIALLSSVGANAESRNRYLRVKGAAERAVIDAGIERSRLFRPSLLVTRTIRYGLQDRVTQALFPLVAPVLPGRYHQIHVEALARAMRLDAERAVPPGPGVLYYPELTRLLDTSPSSELRSNPS